MFSETLPWMLTHYSSPSATYEHRLPIDTHSSVSWCPHRQTPSWNTDTHYPLDLPVTAMSSHRHFLEHWDTLLTTQCHDVLIDKLSLVMQTHTTQLTSKSVPCLHRYTETHYSPPSAMSIDSLNTLTHTTHLPQWHDVLIDKLSLEKLTHTTHLTSQSVLCLHRHTETHYSPPSAMSIDSLNTLTHITHLPQWHDVLIQKLSLEMNYQPSEAEVKIVALLQL